MLVIRPTKTVDVEDKFDSRSGLTSSFLPYSFITGTSICQQPFEVGRRNWKIQRRAFRLKVNPPAGKIAVGKVSKLADRNSDCCANFSFQNSLLLPVES